MIKKFLIILLILSQAAEAAKITGTVYDLDLERITKAVIKIDTKPPQSIVTKNGEYSFFVPQGEYSVKAYQLEGELIVGYDSHDIEVDTDGEFRLDLILIPDLRGDIKLIDETEMIHFPDQFMEKKEKFPYELFLILSIIVLIIISISIFYILRKKRRISPMEDESLVISIIKKKGGRIKQRDLQRETPYSKAKVSLLLTDLQDKGRIRKIPKGRGNVIILKRKK